MHSSLHGCMCRSKDLMCSKNDQPQLATSLGLLEGGSMRDIDDRFEGAKSQLVHLCNKKFQPRGVASPSTITTLSELHHRSPSLSCHYCMLLALLSDTLYGR